MITHKVAANAAKRPRLLSLIPCESCGNRASSLAAVVMGRDLEQPVSQQESIEPRGCNQHLVNAHHKQLLFFSGYTWPHRPERFTLCRVNLL